MPSESDRPIEKLMRDYAADRKAAAKPDEFALHPVTRNALKVEIVKVYGRRLPGEKPTPVWNAWWPKFALGAGGIFVVALLIVFMLSSKPEGDGEVLTVAKNDAAKVSAPAPQSADEFAAVELTAVPASAPLPAPGDPAGSEVFQFFAAKVAVPVATTLTAAPSPAVRASQERHVVPAPPVVSVEIPGAAAPVRQRLSPAPVESARASVAVSVLSTFQLRINGDEVVVIDHDQSRYVGRIRPIDPNALAASSGTGVPASALRDTTDPQFPTNYRLYSAQGGSRAGLPPAGQFTLTGINLTTRQAVTFTGRMLTWTQAEPTASSSAFSSPATLLQIEGSAVLGTDPAISINATTAKP